MKDVIETMPGSILQRSLTRGDLCFSLNSSLSTVDEVERVCEEPRSDDSRSLVLAPPMAMLSSRKSEAFYTLLLGLIICIM